MTPAEKKLWGRVRDNQLAGMHFRKQDPTEKYIVDFVCVKAKLGIEVDGQSHSEPDQAAYDARRTRWLNEHKGYRIIRFSNHDVMRNIEGVLAVIIRELGGEERDGV